MFDADGFVEAMSAHGFAEYGHELASLSQQKLDQSPHGDTSKWQTAIDSLGFPSVTAVNLDRPAPAVEITSQDVTSTTEALKQLSPWRKGPFQLGQVFLDAEWRSDRKWDRLVKHIHPLKGRRILDIGSGNGYYLYRMIGQGAKLAVGIDPTRLFLFQFRALQTFFGQENAFLLPLKDSELTDTVCSWSPLFDTVFSMGVLYHRRESHTHLEILRRSVAPGGQVVLETLVLPKCADTSLRPEGRYAQMRNVWLVPTVSDLKKMIVDCGFENVRVVDVTQTTTEEQRATEWMIFDSLDSFLDCNDSDLTVEGYPAPRRAIVIADSPA
ncbi:MAG: tRNA 5-methoxyuridine(34)/uridine 5-oxyacetic acid(34) synthase CmoB [Pseudomonadota bacterium]